jgi:dipeptidyl aminopeptidase/acylaminoacyl peptidase
MYRKCCLVIIALGTFLVAHIRADDSTPAYSKPEEVRAKFLKLLDRPHVLFNVKNEEAKRDEDSGLVIERLSFASEKRSEDDPERVPVLIYRPEKVTKKLPAVLVLHGTSGSKDSESIRAWMTHLAKRGFIAVGIDARYHGERAGEKHGAEAYVEAITRAWKAKPDEKQEHPFYYDTCWDIWRTADYLETRDDVDADRLGIIGISMGGIETWLAASVDPRFKVAVPAIAVQSFRWSLENDKWQGRANTIKGAHEQAAKDLGEAKVNQKVCRELWSKVCPGILDDFDCPSMIRLFAGRPLLILNGENDGNCPVEGAKLAFAMAEAAYKEKGASEKLKIDVAKASGHTVTNEQRKEALDWFEKWLK